MEELKQLIELLKIILENKKKYEVVIELLNGQIKTLYGEEQSSLMQEALNTVNYEDIKQIKLIRRKKC